MDLAPPAYPTYPYGECWTLADEALRAAGAARTNVGFGRALGPEEEILGGDVIQFENARFEGSYGYVTFPHHTALVERVRHGRRVTLIHQDFGAAGRIVSLLDLDLNELKQGTAVIYRPYPAGR